MKATSQTEIHSYLQENRIFSPPDAFSANAQISSMEEYRALYDRSIRDPEEFWSQIAEQLHWFRRWENTLVWDPPFAQWFVGGQTNLAYNCLDRHLLTARRNKAALIWEGENGESRTLTYFELHREVCKLANVLTDLGVKHGYRVGIYLPLIPEAVISMLACARIGAVHSVVFGGFSAEALRERMNDAAATVIITADGGWRRGGVIALKQSVDEAATGIPSLRHIIVVKRLDHAAPHSWVEGRDHWWHRLLAVASAQHDAPPLDAEHPLFILYTSGTTGKPKGIVHTTGGYMTQSYLTTKWIFDIRDTDTFWCTAEVGWVTGHSYVVYGPLLNGATTFMYEGAPMHPAPDRWWSLIDRWGINILYTAPTAIRAFMRQGDSYPAKHQLASLRLLGTVGEPINPEAWMWYHQHIGRERCPIVDTWWQTETGAILISPLPGAVPTKPGSATLPFFGIVPDVVNRDGESLPAGEGGFLVLRSPWPAMLRTIHRDAERYAKQYWSDIPGCYFTGDGARRDADGYFWLMGRVDDVINVAGHRLGTAEIESALVSHPQVAEAAVVGRPDELKGTAIAAFVTLEAGTKPSQLLKQELRDHVAHEIGSIARPEDIRFAETLPKTRSGKIMRRLLRDLAAGQETVGDTTTLEDLSVLACLREDEET
ncbi:MAG: acetate--CoA ligase [Cyanobacteria bacterium NC_groundwater_1444_Ag_S-0.65um_54_12]|nr:acetate--CoA ligase [Cyanobacteria bacterium NC_groundwater_1444_Ag_S-0.65um_54_12]